MEGRSTVEDRRPRNSYHRVCYVFVAQAASVCHWNWTQWATANVRQKVTVICEVRGSQSTKRLMYEPHDLEQNALTDWQPVQLP